MKKICAESLDSQINGIKQLLSENRCSYSEEEVKLLEDCLTTLTLVKQDVAKLGSFDVTYLFKVADLVMRFFGVIGKLDDSF